ncbi:MAG: hypothetical protein PVI30_11670 [Myxococcales bacterium]|jgi:hypothetical protein
MKRRRSLGAWLCAPALTLVLVHGPGGGTAVAQEARETKATLAPDKEAEYDQAIEIGLQEMQLGNYAEAYAAMLRAHQVYPNARTLRALGIAAFELKRYVTSMRHLRAALDSEEKPLTPELREEVEHLLGRVNTYIDRIEVTVVPAEAELRVDGKPPVRDEDGRVLLTVGEHLLRATHPGHQPAQVKVQADGSSNANVTLQLVSSAAVASGGETATGGTSVDSTQRTWGWITLGAAGVFAVGSGVALGVRESAVADYNSDRCAPMPSVQCADEADTVDSAETFAFVGAGLAGAAAVTGVVLLLTAPDGESESAGADLSCGIGVLSLHCSGRL